MSDVSGSTKQEDKNIEFLIAIWEKTIDVQMHFNDIQLRIRNFSILLLSAFVGGIGVTMKEHYQVLALGHTIPLTAVIFFAGAMIWSAFYFMDRYWYHPLLLGAVAHGLNVEELIATRFAASNLTGTNAKGEVLDAAALTKTIGKKSPVKFFGLFTLRSSHKEHVFYGSIFAVLVAMGIVVLFSTNGAPAIVTPTPSADTSVASTPNRVPPPVVVPDRPGVTGKGSNVMNPTQALPASSGASIGASAPNH